MTRATDRVEWWDEVAAVIRRDHPTWSSATAPLLQSASLLSGAQRCEHCGETVFLVSSLGVVCDVIHWVHLVARPTGAHTPPAAAFAVHTPVLCDRLRTVGRLPLGRCGDA